MRHEPPRAPAPRPARAGAAQPIFVSTSARRAARRAGVAAGAAVVLVLLVLVLALVGR